MKNVFGSKYLDMPFQIELLGSFCQMFTLLTASFQFSFFCPFLSHNWPSRFLFSCFLLFHFLSSTSNFYAAVTTSSKEGKQWACLKLLERNSGIFYAMVRKLTELMGLAQLFLMWILTGTTNANSTKVLFFFPYWVSGGLIKGIVHGNSYLMCFVLVTLCYPSKEGDRNKILVSQGQKNFGLQKWMTMWYAVEED